MTRNNSCPAELDGFSIYRNAPKDSALTMEQEQALVIEARHGNESALDSLVRDNLGFLGALATNEYRKFHGTPMVDIEDVAQSGAVALLDSIMSSFDPDRGVRLRTYARKDVMYAMRKKVFNNSDKDRGVVRTGKKISAIREKLSESEQREVSADEAMRHGITTGELTEGACRRSAVHRQIKGALSLSADERAIGSSCVFTEDYDGRIHGKMAANALMKSIDRNLGDRQKQVVQMFYGLGGYAPTSLQEIADCLCISKSRAQQLKNEAEAKLARDPALKKFRSRN